MSAARLLLHCCMCAVRLQVPHHVINQGLAVKLPPVCKELVEKLLLRDLVIFKLHPGSGVFGGQQLLCRVTRRQARHAHVTGESVRGRFSSMYTRQEQSRA